MTTKLEKTLKREIMIGDVAHIVAIAPEGLKITIKGRRKGIELGWKELAGGGDALVAAVNASMEAMK